MAKAIPFIFLCAILILFGFLFLPTREKDVLFYQKLIESSTAISAAHFSKPMREEVTKEIWVGQEEPLHILIYSKGSELLLLQREEQFTCKEKLSEVEAFMQEELFYLLSDGREVEKMEGGKFKIKGEDPQNPLSWIEAGDAIIPMQTIHVFTAKEGLYDYNSQVLSAKKAMLKKYRIQGHELVHLPENEVPLMSAEMENMEIILQGKKMEFHASHMRTTFTDF